MHHHKEEDTREKVRGGTEKKRKEKMNLGGKTPKDTEKGWFKYPEKEVVGGA